MVREIVAELEQPDSSMSTAIPLASVQAWMSSTDLEVMGAVYTLLAEPAHCARIEPQIDKYRVSAFLRRYFERCIIADPQSEWSDSRYSAGWDVARWLKHWVQSKTLDANELEVWAHWLGELYKNGDDAVRLSIETATLEHVLDDPEVRRLFTSWLKDPQLAAGYQRSLHGPGA